MGRFVQNVAHLLLPRLHCVVPFELFERLLRGTGGGADVSAAFFFAFLRASSASLRPGML